MATAPECLQVRQAAAPTHPAAMHARPRGSGTRRPGQQHPRSQPAAGEAPSLADVDGACTPTLWRRGGAQMPRPDCGVRASVLRCSKWRLLACHGRRWPDLRPDPSTRRRTTGAGARNLARPSARQCPACSSGSTEPGSDAGRRWQTHARPACQIGSGARARPKAAASPQFRTQKRSRRRHLPGTCRRAAHQERRFSRRETVRVFWG